MKTFVLFVPFCGCIFLVGLCSFTLAQPATANREEYLSWTTRQATDIGKKWRVAGRIGWGLKLRIFKSDAYFYELRATLMTPEVIRATARLEQLRRGLTDAQTRELVIEAEKTAGLIALIEINPREGSGVIPLDWYANLHPKGVADDSPLRIAGTNAPELRHVKALAGVNRRDYSYDVFWMVFPLRDQQGKPIWETPPDEIELLVGIHDKEGRVSWRVNDSLRQRLIGSIH